MGQTVAMTIILISVPTLLLANIDRKLQKIKNDLRLGEISQQVAWNRLDALRRQGAFAQSSALTQSDLLQTQAHLLEKAKFPILAAKYAANALATAPDPLVKVLQPSWDLLDLLASKHQIHDIISELASTKNSLKTAPPVFKNNWFYYLGEALLAKAQHDQAIELFKKLTPKDRMYYAAQFQMANSYVEKNDLANAGLILRAMTTDEMASLDSVRSTVRSQYLDQAFLALGRIQYERQKFVSSAKYFRKVRRSSTFYYDALFSQAWAFFLAGYPNHALGALHAVDSPYFPNRFNPETSVLRSIIYYWMCRYDDSKNALASFIEQYSEPVEQLDTWLTKRNLDANKSYQLFENLITGVSSESLGIDRKLLDSAALSPPMIFARERLAVVVEESHRLQKRGIFGSKKSVKNESQFLKDWTGKLTEELGTAYIAELERIRDDYKTLRAQANFIYVELLMSEKEQILGRELHADQKLDKANFRKRIKGWGQGDQAWKASDKGEYWWDELGFFVYHVAPMCQTDQGERK